MLLLSRRAAAIARTIWPGTVNRVENRVAKGKPCDWILQRLNIVFKTHIFAGFIWYDAPIVEANLESFEQGVNVKD